MIFLAMLLAIPALVSAECSDSDGGINTLALGIASLTLAMMMRMLMKLFAMEKMSSQD